MLTEITDDGTYPVKTLFTKSSHLAEFNHSWNQLIPEQQTAIEDKINQRLEELVSSPDPNWGSITNTSIEGGQTSPETGLRGDWRGTPYAPIWDIFGDDEMAGKFFGNVWKKVILARDEMWFGIRSDPTFPNRGVTLMGKTYFLQHPQAA